VGDALRPPLAGCALILLIAGCEIASAPAPNVERYDVALTLLADGSLAVQETIALHVGDVAAARFNRDVPRVRFDTIADISATVDGAGGDGRVDTAVGRWGALHAEWRLAARPQAACTLTLRYRATGALAVEGARGTLKWRALPGSRRYGIGAARIELSVPAEAALTGAPSVGVQGWVVTLRPGGLVAEHTRVEPDDVAEVAVEIGLGAMAIAVPGWQYDADRARELMPAFVSGGVFLLVIGAGVVWMMRLQYGRPTGSSGDAASTRRVDLERAAIVRGLRVSGLVVCLLGLASAAVIGATLEHYGPWPMSIPVGLVGTGMMLVGEGARWRRSARAQ
jgi:hypothetical protein